MPWSIIAFAFNLGTMFTVIGAYSLWPGAVPWSIAFWLGWLASGLSIWLIRKSKTVLGDGQAPRYSP